MARAKSSPNALKEAGKVIARGVRAAAGRFSAEIPEAVKVYLGPGSNTAFVAAGKPGGQWGWTPVHAWMFEEPHSASTPKHPLFAKGPRRGPDGRVRDGWRHWYFQPYRPYLEEGAEATAQEAADVYADLSIAKWCADLGYK